MWEGAGIGSWTLFKDETGKDAGLGGVDAWSGGRLCAIRWMDGVWERDERALGLSDGSWGG
jgi:hypothetical protein